MMKILNVGFKKILQVVANGLLVATTAAGMSLVNAAPNKANNNRGKILVIVSSQSAMELRDGAKYQTGYYLNELTVPVMALTEAGYEIVFANPKGNAPTLDTNSNNASFFANDDKRYREVKAFHDGLTALQKPNKLATLIRDGLVQYRAVLFPGGHAPMQDLLIDTDVRVVLEHFHKTKKPTALICHGPIALLSAMPKANEFIAAMRAGDKKAAASLAQGWQYASYNMTIFSNAEEKVAEQAQLGGKMFFYPEDALTTAGGAVKVATAWNSHVVVDRELITAQNPASDGALVKTLLASLEKK